MMVHASKDTIMRYAESKGLCVIGDDVFSSLLGAAQFIVSLGRGDLTWHRMDLNHWLVVKGRQ